MIQADAILTLEQVKNHLRYDFDDEDDTLTAYIAAASQTIFKHVDQDAYSVENPQLQQAALLLIGYWDAHRNGESAHESWFLPPPVRVLLTPYRTPTAV